MPYNSSRLLYLLKLVGLDTRCSRHLTSTNVGICWSMPSPSWSTLLHFLDQPAVAVRVAERHEAIVIGPRGIEAGGLSLRSEVERLAHIDPAIHELSASGFDIGCDEIHDCHSSVSRPLYKPRSVNPGCSSGRRPSGQ